MTRYRHCVARETMHPRAVVLQQRLRTFVVRIGVFCQTLPPHPLAQRIAPQLIDAAGSASSNYNGACRARSRREFAAKIGVAAEEASEAQNRSGPIRPAQSAINPQ